MISAVYALGGNAKSILYANPFSKTFYVRTLVFYTRAAVT